MWPKFQSEGARLNEIARTIRRLGTARTEINQRLIFRVPSADVPEDDTQSRNTFPRAKPARRGGSGRHRDDRRFSARENTHWRNTQTQETVPARRFLRSPLIRRQRSLSSYRQKSHDKLVDVYSPNIQAASWLRELFNGKKKKHGD